MPVTELALLHILKSSKEGEPELTPTLLNHLRLAKEAMEKASGLKFYYLQCMEDPSLIFILGGWPSVKFHMEEWIPSQENQDLLRLMEGEVEVEYMFHLDLDPKEREGVIGSKVVAVVSHFVKKDEEKEFEKCFEEVKGKLEENIGGHERVTRAWRMDRGFVKGDEPAKQKEGEEWVLFSGWDSLEKHHEFGKSEDSKEYSKIFAHTDGIDIKHGTVLVV